MSARAEMLALTEGDLLVERALEIEAIGILEDCLVPIR
jgi:hypothetical protein